LGQGKIYKVESEIARIRVGGPVSFGKKKEKGENDFSRMTKSEQRGKEKWAAKRSKCWPARRGGGKRDYWVNSKRKPRDKRKKTAGAPNGGKWAV